jgi:hypothetical protein
VFRTIVADLRAHVHSQLPPAWFWPTLVGKPGFIPAIRVVILYRISRALYGFALTRPLGFVLRSVSIVCRA